MTMRRPLRKYQKEVFYSGKNALFLDMRLGKTLITIRRIKALLRKKVNYLVLVVAPTPALNSWQSELDKEGIESILMLGNKKTRQSLLKLAEHNSKRLYFLLNKEAHIAIPEIADIKWDAVILDESHFIKSPIKKSKLTKRINVSGFYLNNFKDVKVKMVLTGTPAPENPIEYYNQIQFVAGDVFNTHSIWEFRFKYFKQFGYEWILLKAGKKFLSSILRDHSYQLTREDTGFKDNKVYQNRYIDLPKKFLKVYKKLVKEFILEYNETQLLTKYAMTKFLWMRKLTSGFIDDRFVWNGKMNELIYLLTTELKNESVVVWCCYTLEIEQIVEELKKKRISFNYVYGKISKRKNMQTFREFNQKKFKVLVCQVESAKYGVDFSVSDSCIYYSEPLGYLSKVQSEDRIISMTKNTAALIISLVVNKSIDTHIKKSQQKKINRVNQMKEIIRGLQNENK